MSSPTTYQAQLEAVLRQLQLPAEIQIRCWTPADMPAIQHLTDVQEWPTQHSSEQVLGSWIHAWPAIVATNNGRVIGYVRGLTDGNVTTYIADLLVDSAYRGQGIGKLLLEVCHRLYPVAYMTLVAETSAEPFYQAVGFKKSGQAYLKWVRQADVTKRD